MQDSVRETVFRIVSNIMHYPIEKVGEDTSPDTVPIWDSLRHMNLVLALEEELNVEFTETQIVEMNSVGLILAIVDEASVRR